MFLILNAVLFAVDFVFLRHGKLFGGHEMERRIEMAHGHDERVDGAAVLQVANEIDVEAFKCALCLIDRVEVQHTL